MNYNIEQHHLLFPTIACVCMWEFEQTCTGQSAVGQGITAPQTGNWVSHFGPSTVYTMVYWAPVTMKHKLTEGVLRDEQYVKLVIEI